MNNHSKRQLIFWCSFIQFLLMGSDESASLFPKNVCIIGTGYVGLISGGILAEYGHHVTCVDINEEKINQLNKLIMPIYEPGLEKLITKNVARQRLIFSAKIDQAILDNNIIVIAVGTPMDDEGAADLSALKAVLKTIARNLNSYKIICIKSTVPIGTHIEALEILKKNAPGYASYDIVSNPEFLRQGTAIQDFLQNNPIVIGSDSAQALNIMKELYEPFATKVKIITTDLPTAETVKYAHNCFLATRICFVNELSHLCMAAGADISKLVEIMADGERMYPTQKLRPGPGIGGSCLPKDTIALVKNAKKYDINLRLIETVVASNIEQKEKMITYVHQLLGESLVNKKIAIWGLSFKADTDDIRYSPAITIIKRLLEAGAQLQAYDPQAMKYMQQLFPNIRYCTNKYEALENVNLLIILTEWAEFKNFDIDKAATLMAEKIIFDTRNILPRQKLNDQGFTFLNLGARTVKKSLLNDVFTLR